MSHTITNVPTYPDTTTVAFLNSVNDTQRPYMLNGCLHEQIVQTSNIIAVTFGVDGGQLTYRELHERANQLAHFLQQHGVGPDTLVTVCLERSLGLIVALLAVLKAGGAYVPVDPAYPTDRIAFMLADAQAPLLLTHSDLIIDLPEFDGETVTLDTVRELLATLPATAPDCAATAENLAYVIYTSGSTGRPKGAMNSHRAIVNRLLWMQEEYQLTAADRILQKTPFSFDVSVWEFFWPLLNGARLVFAKPEGHKDAGYLVDLIRQAGITVMHFVPSMLQLFLDAPEVEGCTSLRHVICSGEALPAAAIERFYARLDADLHNLYGPTEAAVDVTYWPCPRDWQEAEVPIGRPVANTQIHILDDPATAGAGWNDRRIVHRWGTGGTRVLAAATVDGRAICRVRDKRMGDGPSTGEGAPVPDGRSGPLAAGWHDRLSGPHRFSGQVAWFPHRIGRNRSDHPSNMRRYARLSSWPMNRLRVKSA